MDTNRTSGFVGLARLFWMMGGPALMLFLAAIILQRGGDWYSLVSLAFLIILVATVFVRRLDPQNGYGEPSNGAHGFHGATMNHLSSWE